MTGNRWMGVVGATLVGVLLLVTAVPVRTSANANFWWNQMTGQDFAGDTMTNVHVSNVNPGIYFVHLVDDESASYDFDYNPATQNDIWDQPFDQLVGTYSQSFTPNITGVVDRVDMRVYRVGTPKTVSGADAKLIIKITDANQTGIHEPYINNVKVEYSFLPSQVPNVTGLHTYFLTEFDSCYSSALTSGTIYDIVVTSDAARDQQGGASYHWEYTSTQNTANTVGCTKQYDEYGQPSWVATGAPAFDLPFKVYVHNFVHSGDIVSSVHNCFQQVFFSETSIDHREGGVLLFKVRTGPTSSPDGSWSDWVDQGYGSQNPGLDPNQYVQFKIDYIAGMDDLKTEGVDLVHIGWL